MHSKCDLIQNILDIYRAQLLQPKEEWPQEVKRVVNYIHENLFHPKLSVRWLKEQCRINGSHFSTTFKHYIGKTPKQYIQEHRLEAAKRLLVDKKLPNLSITQIALTVGYSGKGTFNHAFKKLEGITPRQWQKYKRIN